MQKVALEYDSLIIGGLQINVATQRGFIPVDERMRVIDEKGNLVGRSSF